MAELLAVANPHTIDCQLYTASTGAELKQGNKVILVWVARAELAALMTAASPPTIDCQLFAANTGAGLKQGEQILMVWSSGR